MPDYDGRPEPGPDLGEMLLWVPRVLFWPVHAFVEYVLRRPIGCILTAGARERWDALQIQPFSEEQPSWGIVPTVSFDLGFRPSGGVSVWLDDLCARGDGAGTPESQSRCGRRSLEAILRGDHRSWRASHLAQLGTPPGREPVPIAELEDRSLIWVSLEGFVNVALGNALGRTLDELEVARLRTPFSRGVRAAGDPDRSFTMQNWLGTATFADGLDRVVFRLTAGVQEGF